MGSLWPTLLSLLAVMLGAYAVHLGFSAQVRAEDAARHAADAADVAELAIKAHGNPRGPRNLRRIASGGAERPSPWTPPNG